MVTRPPDRRSIDAPVRSGTCIGQSCRPEPAHPTPPTRMVPSMCYTRRHRACMPARVWHPQPVCSRINGNLPWGGPVNTTPIRNLSDPSPPTMIPLPSDHRNGSHCHCICSKPGCTLHVPLSVLGDTRLHTRCPPPLWRGTTVLQLYYTPPVPASVASVSHPRCCCPDMQQQERASG